MCGVRPTHNLRGVQFEIIHTLEPALEPTTLFERFLFKDTHRFRVLDPIIRSGGERKNEKIQPYVCESGTRTAMMAVRNEETKRSGAL